MEQVILNKPSYLNLKLFDLKMISAPKSCEEGTLSSGQAAEMTGLSKRAFIEVLGKYGVSFIGYDFDELALDLGNA
jgi:predicted HTH domain antitoxin